MLLKTLGFELTPFGKAMWSILILVAFAVCVEVYVQPVEATGKATQEFGITWWDTVTENFRGKEVSWFSSVSTGSSKQTKNYQVKSGDTLSKITAWSGVPVKILQKDNGLDDNSILYPGDRLYIRKW